MNELINYSTHWTYLHHNYDDEKEALDCTTFTLIFSAHLGNLADILGSVQSLEFIIPRLFCGGQNVSTFLRKENRSCLV